MGHRDQCQFVTNLLRQFRQIFGILFGEQHRLNPRPVSRNRLLLQPPNRQNLPPERHFTRHRHIPAHRPPRKGRNNRRRHTNTGTGTILGRGTGLDDQGLQHKTAVLKAALAKHGALANPFAMLCTFGGFEIAMMVGAILAACEKKMVVMIDGFIASSAAAIAFALEPPARDYCIFSHLSNESGHKKILDYLQVSPLVSLGLRLGEGSGVAVTYPLIQSAVLFLNDMASFDDAGVSNQ